MLAWPLHAFVCVHVHAEVKKKKNACFNCEQERESDLHTVVTLFLNIVD